MTPARWVFRGPSPGQEALSGPNDLPFDLTKVVITDLQSTVPAGLANGTGLVPMKIESPLNEKYYTGQTHVFMVRRNVNNILRIFDQGTVNENGIIELVGVKTNDVIAAVSWDGRYFDTQRYTNQPDIRLQLDANPWRPSVTAYPITNTIGNAAAISIAVEIATPVEGNLMAALLPLNSFVPITDAISLNPQSPTHYVGEWTLDADQTLDEGYLWVGEVISGSQNINENLPKQIVIPITLDGSPGSHKRSNPPKHPASSDGYCELHLPDAEWIQRLPVIVLSPHHVPNTNSSLELISSPCYIGVPNTIADFTEPVALTIYYNKEAAAGKESSQLSIYHWDTLSSKWEPVDSATVNASIHNISQHS
ncbi:MAG: hypothetical protein R3A44_27335 [Caldilineaceae bacterium]